jgi:hypothetical protein
MPEARAGAARGVVLAVYGLGVSSWWLYQHGSPVLAHRIFALYAGCLVVGPALAYAALRHGGSGAGTAALCALGVPVLWLAKELHRVTAVHPLLESLYYALNPVSVGVFGAAAVPMALVEIGWRRRRLGRWRPAGWPGVVLAAFALLAVVAGVVGHDSGGREIFYAYVAFYRVLFGGGGS